MIVKTENLMQQDKVFNFLSIRSVLITKIKTETSQKCEHKIETGGNGNLMPVSMFKSLLQNATIAELNKYINNVVLHTCITHI